MDYDMLGGSDAIGKVKNIHNMYYIDNLFYYIVSKGNTWEKQEKVREETLG